MRFDWHGKSFLRRCARQAGDGRRASLIDRRAAAMLEHPSRDLVLACEPDAGLGACIRKEAIVDPSTRLVGGRRPGNSYPARFSNRPSFAEERVHGKRPGRPLQFWLLGRSRYPARSSQVPACSPRPPECFYGRKPRQPCQTACVSCDCPNDTAINTQGRACRP
jgi:hypothetical protein